MQERVILGIDPGLNNTGWGIVLSSGSRLNFIAGGTIKTKPKEAMAQRLNTIHQGLAQVIEQYGPTEVAVEEVYVNDNARTSLKLGQARGIAILAAGLNALPCAEYTPSQVKKAVVGTGRAVKNQMGYMVKMLLPTADLTSEDMADACAVAICHAHSS